MSGWFERRRIEFAGKRFFFLLIFWLRLLHGNPPFALIGCMPELMIVRSMTLGNFLFAYLTSELAVCLHALSAGKPFLLVPKNPAQLVQEPCNCKSQKGFA